MRKYLLPGAILAQLTGAVVLADDNALVLWNQHNGAAKDRGTTACRIEAFNGVSTLWKVDRLEIPWDANSDTKVSVTIPKQRSTIERIRITLLETAGSGGGLSEIEFYQGGVNIARQAKASASGFYQNDQHYSPQRAIDGITTSANFSVGYWLLPDAKPGKTGWIELAFQRH